MPRRASHSMRSTDSMQGPTPSPSRGPTGRRLANDRGAPDPGPGAPSRTALSALADTCDEGMLLVDQDGYVLYANSACRQLLGYAPEELVGMLGFDLCRPGSLAEAQRGFQRSLTTPEATVVVEVAIEHRDGHARPVVARLVNHLPSPSIRAIVVVVKDARPEPTTEESYRVLFEDALLGLGVADMEGNLLVFNDAMLKPGGYTRADILQLGKVSRLYADPDDRERIIRIAREQGLVWREDVPFLRKDGSPYDTLLSLTPIRFRGQSCWYATVEDVTEQKEAQRERRQLEAKLQHARKMEAVGTMTAGVAHDFNNILSVIIANAELIAANLDPDAAEARSDLAELRDTAMRGSSMIRKLLGYSRNADLTIAPTDLAAVVDRLRSELRPLLPTDITLDVPAAEPCMALCDGGAVEQMALNLATNARDAMPHGGTLSIVAETLRVEEDAPQRPEWLTPGVFVRLSVADTGMGMDEATRARVLEPFFTTKPPGAGTGLGLSMVYGLVKQQKGFIQLLTEPGEGTTVHLYFPGAETG